MTPSFCIQIPARGSLLRSSLAMVAVALGWFGLSGCVSVPLAEGNSATAATSEVAVEQSLVDLHRDLFEEVVGSRLRV